MGRGLSDLQRFIVREAAERGVLFAEDIKADYFQFEPRPKKAWSCWWRREGGRIEEFDAGEWKAKKSWHELSPWERYNKTHFGENGSAAAANVSLCRAFSRLRRRGLIEHRRVRGREDGGYLGMGTVLTQSGRQYAAEHGWTAKDSSWAKPDGQLEKENLERYLSLERRIGQGGPAKFSAALAL